jgi:predicted O-methyltransferase YrrM
MVIDGEWILGLLDSYHEELTDLSLRVRKQYWHMRGRGHGATFSDFEGEVMYCLLRELEPETFFEISPDCGYSTIYAYEAIARNGTGKHFAFELETEKHGAPTADVLQSNACRPFDSSRFELVLGDAAKTTSRFPDPDIVLIDSCHEQWFAEWYWEHLLPRVRVVALVQDIVFHDRPEPSTEARWLLDTLQREQVPFLSLGVLERRPEAARVRRDFAPRRPYETNSILLAGAGSTVVPLLPEEQSLDPQRPDDVIRLENAYSQPPRKAPAHRDLAAIARHYTTAGDPALAKHYWTRAVAHALEAANRDEGKALSELVTTAVRDGRPRRALGVIGLSALYCRAAIPRAARASVQRAKGKAVRVLRPSRLARRQ